MEIEGTTFGTITIDGKTYEHDVIIRLSGEVVKRKKKLSKKYYGTSHVLSKDEAKFVFEKGCEQLGYPYYYWPWPYWGPALASGFEPGANQPLARA
jgi:hypothetical protein